MQWLTMTMSVAFVTCIAKQALQFFVYASSLWYNASEIKFKMNTALSLSNVFPFFIQLATNALIFTLEKSSSY